MRLAQLVTPRLPYFYFYHPLTPTDLAAFDAINLDPGAYEFIENSLNLRGDISPYFGMVEDELKKRQNSAAAA